MPVTSRSRCNGCFARASCHLISRVHNYATWQTGPLSFVATLVFSFCFEAFKRSGPASPVASVFLGGEGEKKTRREKNQGQENKKEGKFPIDLHNIAQSRRLSNLWTVHVSYRIV